MYQDFIIKEANLVWWLLWEEMGRVKGRLETEFIGRIQV